MKFSLLLLIDCPPTGFGLSVGQSFGEQLGRRFQQLGYTLTIDTRPLTVSDDLGNWLRNLPLAEYDLIVIQPPLRDLPGPRFGLADAWLRRTGRSAGLGSLVEVVLVPLRGHRHRTLLLTPFPHRSRAKNQVIWRAGQCLTDLGEQVGLVVLDTAQLIGTGEEYFLPYDPARLSAVGHELIGSWLYDFYWQRPVPVLADGSNRLGQ
jgi:hypothetical protein